MIFDKDFPNLSHEEKLRKLLDYGPVGVDDLKNFPEILLSCNSLPPEHPPTPYVTPIT